MPRSLAVALLLWSSIGLGQVQEKIDVTVTNLDVIVTDSAGKPVHGLTPADFEIAEGRSRREITNLSEIVAAPDAPPAAQPPARSVLILFDNSTLTLANRRVAAEAAKGWLAQNLRPADAVAVATAIPSLVLKQPWTTDKSLVATAIDAASADTTSYGEEQRRQAEQKVESVVGRAASPMQGEVVKFDEAVQAVRVYAESVKRDVLATASSLNAALTYFPKRGRKNVMLIVGEGLPSQPGSEMFQYLNSVKMDIESGAGPALLKSGAAQASPLTESSSYDVTSFLQKVAASAVKAGVMVYALNPGTNENTSGQVQAMAPRDTRADFARSAGARSGYELLVGKTGGTAFYGMPPQMAMGKIAADLDSYYSIGYRSAPNAVSEKLTVRTRGGYRVRFTRGAVPQTADEVMKESVLANHVAKPFSNDLRIKLAADPSVADGERRKVPLKVLIPIDGLRLDREGEEVVGIFSVYVSSGDEKGNATEVNRQTKEVRFPSASVEQLKGKTIGFAIDVMVPKNLNQISVGVLDERSEATGFDRLTI